MKQILIILGIVLISLSSAMYAGESETFDFGFEIVNCSIINNTYNLNGLTLSWNGTNATISTVVNYQPDSFVVNCWVIKYKEVIQESTSSSSSSKKHYDIHDLIGSYTKWLRKGETITFELEDEHVLKITKINDHFILIEINSETIYVTLEVGEEKKISVEEEGVNDLFLKLIEIDGNKAKLTIERIQEVVHTDALPDPEVYPNVEGTVIDLIDDKDDQTPIDFTSPIPSKEKSYWYLYVLGILILGIGGYFIVIKLLDKYDEVDEETTDELDSNIIEKEVKDGKEFREGII